MPHLSAEGLLSVIQSCSPFVVVVVVVTDSNHGDGFFDKVPPKDENGVPLTRTYILPYTTVYLLQVYLLYTWLGR